MTSLRLTDKGRSLVQHIKQAVADLAIIWREPFETYDAAGRVRWAQRRDEAQRVYAALMNQLLD